MLRKICVLKEAQAFPAKGTSCSSCYVDIQSTALWDKGTNSRAFLMRREVISKWNCLSWRKKSCPALVNFCVTIPAKPVLDCILSIILAWALTIDLVKGEKSTFLLVLGAHLPFLFGISLGQGWICTGPIHCITG